MTRRRPRPPRRPGRKVSLLVTLAAAAGVAIGFAFGNLGREAKLPGEAIRTDDATGHWTRHAEPTADVNAEILTNTRIRLVMQALPTYALLNAGELPDTLGALVSAGLLGKDAATGGTAPSSTRSTPRTASSPSAPSGPTASPPTTTSRGRTERRAGGPRPTP